MSQYAFYSNADGTNSFVDVSFILSARSITCTFMNQQQGINNLCSVNVTYGTNCEQILGVYSSTGPSNPLPTPPFELLGSVVEYCFTVTASSGNKSVVVEGNLNLLTSITKC